MVLNNIGCCPCFSGVVFGEHCGNFWDSMDDFLSYDLKIRSAKQHGVRRKQIKERMIVWKCGQNKDQHQTWCACLNRPLVGLIQCPQSQAYSWAREWLGDRTLPPCTGLRMSTEQQIKYLTIGPLRTQTIISNFPHNSLSPTLYFGTKLGKFGVFPNCEGTFSHGWI